MLEGVAEMARTDAWSGLLEETRRALSTLRAEDLEELARRAQTMFQQAEEKQARQQGPPLSSPGISPPGNSTSGVSPRGISPDEWAKLSAEHRLLGDLLQATEKNLRVLRRLRDRSRSGEGNTPWVR
jgi:hypothetical protein